MASREFPTWLRIIINVLSIVGVSATLMGKVQPLLGLLILLVVIPYSCWEMAPWLTPLVFRRPILSFALFTFAGAAVGASTWFIWRKFTAPVPVAITDPAVYWAPPVAISAGIPLTAVQLNAMSPIAGIFTYDPPVGTALAAGIHQLKATFHPTDGSRFREQTASTSIAVTEAPRSYAPPVSSEARRAPASKLVEAQEALVSSRGHLITQKAKEAFIGALSGMKGEVRLTCPTADEQSCIYAASFIDLFKTAGWTVDGGIVNRVTLALPYSGIRVFSFSDAPFDPNQEPGTGHWMAVTDSSVAIQQAFVNIGIGTDKGGELDLPKDVTNIYFGPEEEPSLRASLLAQTKQDLEKIAGFRSKHK